MYLRSSFRLGAIYFVEVNSAALRLVHRLASQAPDLVQLSQGIDLPAFRHLLQEHDVCLYVVCHRKSAILFHGGLRFRAPSLPWAKRAFHVGHQYDHDALGGAYHSDLSDLQAPRVGGLAHAAVVPRLHRNRDLHFPATTVLHGHPL